MDRTPQREEFESDDRQVSARNGQSGRSSNFQVILPCFLASGHWIGGTLFLRLIGSIAAEAVIGNDIGMLFERPVSGVEQPLQSDSYGIPRTDSGGASHGE